MKIKLTQAIFVLIASVLLAGCSSSGTEPSSAQLAHDQVELNKPLAERSITNIRLIQGETPESFAASGMGLVLVSGEVSYDHYKKSYPSLVSIQPVSGFEFLLPLGESSYKETRVHAFAVKAGKYQISSFRDLNGSLDLKQAARRLTAVLGDSVEVTSGEAVYIGEITAHLIDGFVKGKRFQGLSQVDRFDKAQKWISENLPNFSGALVNRPISCSLCKLREQGKFKP